MSREMSHAEVDLAGLRDVLLHVLGQDLVDERLVPDFPPAGLLPKSLEHARIDANGDQLARFAPERRPAHPSHRLELRRR
jgi:hypothetical protein